MLIQCINQVDASFIMVTNEIGRLYRDLLGRVNQILAQQADEVYLMVAGLPLQIKPAKL